MIPIVVLTSPRGRIRTLKIVLAVTAVLAVAFAIVAFITWRSDTTLNERGTTTTGSVVVSHYAPQGTSSITVHFNDAGGIAHEEVIDVSGSPQPEGRVVTVTYDPQNPATIRLAGPDATGNMGPMAWLGIAGLFGGVALASLLVLWFVTRRLKAGR